MTAPALAVAHHVPGVSFSPADLAERRKHLGASEIPVVAGLNKHRTPLDVWAEKRGMVPPFSGNEFTEWGLRLEGAILQKYMEVTGLAVKKPGTVIDPKNPWRSCSPDGVVFGVDEPPAPSLVGATMGVEVKRYGEHRTDDFGPAGTDQVPDDVAAQGHWSMAILGVPRWDVAVLLGQADFRIYHLHFDTVIADHLFNIGKEFWFNHVVEGVQPPIDGTTASHKFLQQFFSTHTNELKEPTVEQVELVAQLRGIKKVIKTHEADASAIESQLKLAIGNAAGLKGLCTWKAPKSGYVGYKGALEQVAHEQGIPADVVARAIAANTNEATRRFLLSGGKDS